MIDTENSRWERIAGALQTSRPDAKWSLGRAVDAFLGHRADFAAHLDRALAIDAGLATAHLLRGFAPCFLGRRDRSFRLSNAEFSYGVA